MSETNSTDELDQLLMLEACTYRNALNKIDSVRRGVECGFLNTVEATERLMVIRNETEEEMATY